MLMLNANFECKTNNNTIIMAILTTLWNKSNSPSRLASAASATCTSSSMVRNDEKDDFKNHCKQQNNTMTSGQVGALAETEPASTISLHKGVIGVGIGNLGQRVCLV